MLQRRTTELGDGAWPDQPNNGMKTQLGTVSAKALCAAFKHTLERHHEPLLWICCRSVV